MEFIKTAVITFSVIIALGLLAGIYCEMLEIRSRLLTLREDILQLDNKLVKQEREKADGRE